MRGVRQEEEQLKQLKAQEQALHDELVSATQQLKLARQEVVSWEASLQLTMAKLSHVRRQMDVIWQSAP
ncbi:MAG: hypothetical protein GY803_06515 [Chloroflexi bacterium]|nr:hypothetical protein [Chloroflexota bacterium]